MDQSFCNPVRRRLNGEKSSAGNAAALMMGAVDQAGPSVELVKDGAWSVEGRMDLIMTDVFMAEAGGKLLDDRSAEVDVDDLQTSADAQHRLSGRDKGVQKRKLRFVQRRVHIFGAMVFLSEPFRADISAAGQQKPGIAMQAVGMERYIKGNPACQEGCFVVLGKFWVSGNQNTHILILYLKKFSL